MPSAVAVDPVVLAQALALECEKEQHPNSMRTWEDMPGWLKNHWIEKAQRPEHDGGKV